MRLIFRLVILSLAAVGAKTLYEQFKPMIDDWRGGSGTGTAFPVSTPSVSTGPTAAATG